MILQYYVLFDLFYAGVHTLNVRCAQIREIYDIKLKLTTFDIAHHIKD